MLQTWVCPGVTLTMCLSYKTAEIGDVSCCASNLCHLTHEPSRQIRAVRLCDKKEVSRLGTWEVEGGTEISREDSDIDRIPF
jgi:hypothetical protein